jgi:CDP-diglyceride synthetase
MKMAFDDSEQQKTWSGFLKGAVIGIIVSIIVVLLMMWILT